jgi:hypothetical protein
VRVTGTAQRAAWLARTSPPVEQVRPDLWSVPVPIPGSPLRYTLIRHQFAAGGTSPGGYHVSPMGFVNEPFNGGGHSAAPTTAAGKGTRSRPWASTRHQRGQAVQPHGDRQAVRQYNAIGFRSLGIVCQPSIPWQNRPTFQQVLSFPAHRPG